MRVYFQKQCSVQPVTAKESLGVIELARKYYSFQRWGFSKGVVTSEMQIVPEPCNEEKENRAFQAFSKEIEEKFPKVTLIKLQFYSIHEVPTSCFVLEKKAKQKKSDKLAPTAPVEVPPPWNNDTESTDPGFHQDDL